MKPLTDPRKTVAIVVGVERYRGGFEWNLHGPARDARRFVRWLLDRGVPAQRILLFLSPLPANQDWSPPDGIQVRPATQQTIYDALTTELPELDGELLFLYWGGHGVMTLSEHRRLFYADAAVDDKRNLDLDLLLRFFRNDACRFPRQLAIVDACQNYLDERELLTSLPHQTFPDRGADEERQQFVLFAAQPGELAKNSDSQQAGVFSDHVLKDLERDPGAPWPPDMPALLNRLLERFEELREAGDVSQTPTALTYRNWGGERGTIWELQRDRPDGRPRERVADPTPEPSLGDRLDLTTALLDTRFGERAARDRMLHHVRRREIRDLSPRDPADRFDVLGILDTSLQYPGGLEELVAVVKLFDHAEARPIQALDRVLRRVFPTWR